MDEKILNIYKAASEEYHTTNSFIHYIYIALFSALKVLYIEGGISSTTTNEKQPPG